jgi:hypothetical protein
LVPDLLLLAVSLSCRRMLLPILLPIARISGTPFVRALPAHLAVFRVGADLLFVILRTTPLLTFHRPADLLAGLEL